MVDAGYRYAVATSHQHAPDAPRLRLVVPMSRPCLPHEYVRVRASFLARYEIPADPKTGDLGAPLLPADVARRRRGGVGLVARGRSLDVDAELLLAPPIDDDHLELPSGGDAAEWVATAGAAADGA